MKAACLFFALFLFSFAEAATVDTVVIKSAAMNKSHKCVVIKPSSYNKDTSRFPVVYLLHGHGGDYANWIKRVPLLQDYADKYGMLIVCPDGNISSWYWDSPIDSTMKYETYIAKEVPSYIDNNYRTITKREARAITGLSMGGHGAIYIAFRHSETFGACGSMSGAVDLSYSKNKYDIAKRIGDTLNYAANWVSYAAVGAVQNLPKKNLSIIIDCGNLDYFAPANKTLHEKLNSLKIPHDYIERPGNHDWNYWRNSIEFHLLFFSKIRH